VISKIVWAALLLAVEAICATAGEIPGKIAIVGLDHQIYLADPNGGAAVPATRSEAGREAKVTGGVVPVGLQAVDERATGERRFSYPTWSPDGKALVAQAVTLAGGNMVQDSGIYKIDVQHPGVVSPLYESKEKGPIYLYYSPTGKEIAALVRQQGPLGLAIVGVADGAFHPVGNGFPYYFSWRTDGDAIATHTGAAPDENHTAEVALIDIRGARKGGKPEVTKLSARPVPFRSPAWSPDGSQLVYAVSKKEGRGATLVMRTKNGDEKDLASVSTGVVFSFAPDGKTLAVAEATAPDNLMFGGINLIHIADGHKETMYAGPVGAFFWAPDGSQILVAAPDFDSGEWRWEVVSRATKEVKSIGRFFPTPEFQFMAPHFDQYAKSHLLWAPDSQHFVYSGYPTTANDEKKPVAATVWIADTKTAKVRRVGDGRVAFWSPQ
jgi:hypothetical protein